MAVSECAPFPLLIVRTLTGGRRPFVVVTVVEVFERVVGRCTGDCLIDALFIIANQQLPLRLDRCWQGGILPP